MEPCSSSTDRILSLPSTSTGQLGEESTPSCAIQEPDSSTKGVQVLRVKNLDRNFTRQNVFSLFKSFGTIIRLRMYTSEDGKSTGVADIMFMESSAAEEAVELIDVLYLLQPLEVEVVLSYDIMNDPPF